MSLVGLNASSQIFDPKTGRLTSEGFRLVQSLVEIANQAAGASVTVDAVQTLTNKTIDGDQNTLTDIATSSLKTVTGVIARVVTGTAGPVGQLSQWNANGDLIGAGFLATDVLETSDIGVFVQAYDPELDVWATKTAPTGVVVGTTDAQTLSNKTFGVPPIFPAYTVAGVPSAATYANGVIIVTNEVGGRTLATSDGTNWRRVSNGAIIS